jgi:hypothetical protein
MRTHRAIPRLVGALSLFGLLSAALVGSAFAAKHVEVDGTVTSVGLGTLQLEKSNGNDFKVRLPEGVDLQIPVGSMIYVTGDTDRSGAIVADKWELLAPPVSPMTTPGGSPATAPAMSPTAPLTSMTSSSDCDYGSAGCWKNACDFNDKECYADHKP